VETAVKRVSGIKTSTLFYTSYPLVLYYIYFYYHSTTYVQYDHDNTKSVATGEEK
tara:strand:+ start:165 stop:329 length:165 start_codon:yes stop_codon:yes gene_type:complete